MKSTDMITSRELTTTTNYNVLGGLGIRSFGESTVQTDEITALEIIASDKCTMMLNGTHRLELSSRVGFKLPASFLNINTLTIQEAGVTIQVAASWTRRDH